jgi:hypothetical protein
MSTAFVIVVLVLGEAFLIWFLVALVQETARPRSATPYQVISPQARILKFPAVRRTQRTGGGAR